jgi:hypothetical protein
VGTLYNYRFRFPPIVLAEADDYVISFELFYTCYIQGSQGSCKEVDEAIRVTINGVTNVYSFDELILSRAWEKRYLNLSTTEPTSLNVNFSLLLFLGLFREVYSIIEFILF